MKRRIAAFWVMVMVVLFCLALGGSAVGGRAEGEIPISPHVDIDALRAVEYARAYEAALMTLDPELLVSIFLNPDAAEMTNSGSNHIGYQQTANGVTASLGLSSLGAARGEESAPYDTLIYSIRSDGEKRFEREAQFMDALMVRSFLSDSIRERYAPVDLPFLPLTEARDAIAELFGKMGIEAIFTEQMAVRPETGGDAYVFHMAQIIDGMRVNDMFRGVPVQPKAETAREMEIRIVYSEVGLEQAYVLNPYDAVRQTEEAPAVPFDEAHAKVLEYLNRGLLLYPIRIADAEWVLFQRGDLTKEIELRPTWIFTVIETDKAEESKIRSYRYFLVDGITGEMQIGDRN